MAFINPFFLYLLPLAGIPILIHLIGRRRYHKQEFSTLRFLKQLEVDLIRKLKIRQVFLLILRVLLIIIIILVFARPHRSTQSPGIYVAKGQTLYLIIDNSLSMQGQIRGTTILENGKVNIGTAADQIDFPVYLKLIETTVPWQIQDFGLINDPVELKNICGNVWQTNQGGNIDQAFKRIFRDMQAENELSPAIWVLSDFQVTDWQKNVYADHPVDQLLDNTDSRLIAFPVRATIDNIALSSISVPAQIFQTDQSVLVRGFLRNWTSEKRDVSVTLQLDDQKLGQALLTIQPSAEGSVQFEFIPSSPGNHKAYLNIPDDDLLMDNQRYFSVDIPGKIRVLIIARNPQDGEYIRHSIGMGELSVIETKLTSPVLFATEDLSGFDLMIFSNIDQLPGNITSKIHLFCETNRSILLFPGRDCDPDNFNRLWSQEFGFPKWRTTQRAEEGQYLKIGQLKMEHPLFKQMLRDHESFDYSPEFYVVPGFSIGKNHQVLATFEDHTPLIIESGIHESTGILMAAAPVPGWSNLHFTGFFPAIMNRLVFYLSQQGYRERQYITGDSLWINPAATNISENISIQTPGNRMFKLAVKNQESILFDETDKPGFYDVYSNGELVKRYVVNVPESESSAEFLTEQNFREMIARHPGQMDVFFIDKDNHLNPLKQSREFSDWLIIFALIIALSESYLGRTNRKIRNRISHA